MYARLRVEVPIRDAVGQIRGQVVIALLPGSFPQHRIPPLVDFRGTSDYDQATEPVQILEGNEYRYELHLDRSYPSIRTDMPEVFEADTGEGLAGRLRPGLHTGWLSVGFLTEGHEIGRSALEVRSRKLGYNEHYQWMLRDIANEFAEVVMERFAVTQQRFQAAGIADALTVYQRFAFLRSLIAGGEFQAAIHQIIARPYVMWEAEDEIRPIGRGLRASSRLGRQLFGAGPRVIVDPPLFGLGSLPRFVSSSRTEVTVDNAPNRFVKFALESWRDVALHTSQILSRERQNAPVRRGLREADALRGDLDALLSEELFREVGALEHFPTGNQVLQKREGYRDIFRAYIQFDVAAKLSWEALEDGYRAGQRNVATLYEYWVFVQLAKIVAEFCGTTFDIGRLLKPDGLSIGLKRPRESVIRGVTSYLGRRLRVELAFNRTFKHSQLDTPEGSWTLQLRPDCSLRIGPDKDDDKDFVPVWLHFDAKYRLDSVRQAFAADTVPEADGIVGKRDATEERFNSAAKEDDIIKMHAYRDAIKRSAGAYVIYPGEERALKDGAEQEKWPEYHEVLPGLGAFALRPSKYESDQPEGASLLRSFIREVIEHVGSQITRHERGRYWRNAIYADPPRQKAVSWASFLRRPPADTWVALANLESEAELAWIHQNKLYPVSVDRATGQPDFDPHVLTADLVLVYGALVPPISLFRTIGEPEVLSGVRLRDRGLTSADSQFYYCLRMEAVEATVWSSELELSAILGIRQRKRPEAEPSTPIAVTWLDLVLE